MVPFSMLENATWISLQILPSAPRLAVCVQVLIELTARGMVVSEHLAVIGMLSLTILCEVWHCYHFIVQRGIWTPEGVSK